MKTYKICHLSEQKIWFLPDKSGNYRLIQGDCILGKTRRQMRKVERLRHSSDE